MQWLLFFCKTWKMGSEPFPVVQLLFSFKWDCVAECPVVQILGQRAICILKHGWWNWSYQTWISAVIGQNQTRALHAFPVLTDVQTRREHWSYLSVRLNAPNCSHILGEAVHLQEDLWTLFPDFLNPKFILNSYKTI